jgi:hypothetical protein
VTRRFLSRVNPVPAEIIEAGIGDAIAFVTVRRDGRLEQTFVGEVREDPLKQSVCPHTGLSDRRGSRAGHRHSPWLGVAMDAVSAGPPLIGRLVGLAWPGIPRKCDHL